MTKDEEKTQSEYERIAHGEIAAMQALAAIVLVYIDKLIKRELTMMHVMNGILLHIDQDRGLFIVAALSPMKELEIIDKRHLSDLDNNPNRSVLAENIVAMCAANGPQNGPSALVSITTGVYDRVVVRQMRELQDRVIAKDLERTSPELAEQLDAIDPEWRSRRRPDL